jgi:hypothetical protein
MTSPQDEQLKAYDQLCDSYRAIDDFRAKLLGFLPLATGTGVFLLLTDQAKIVSMQNFFKPIGLFGFVITLGLLFYELYGIKKCHSLITAGIEIEKNVLKVSNGQFVRHPPGVALFINEALAASVIYPAVLAAWTFLAFAFPQIQDQSTNQAQRTVPLIFQEVARERAIEVFLAGFVVIFFYNLFLIKDDIRNAIARLKTKLQSAATADEKRSQ